jgi:hypothetical protein
MSILDTSGIIIADGKITTQHQENARFLKEIKALKLKNEKLINSKKSKNEITSNIQLLVIKYLKLLDDVKLDNTNKSKLLSIIINRRSENIRQFLSNPQSKISNKAKRKNFNYVISLFESLNLNDAAKLAKKDLSKLPPEKE